MSQTEAPPDLPLVADRACGACNVCCVALTIDDPVLQKPQGYRCRNTLPDKGCAIYATRPAACRSFHCGWRHLKWVRETLRPDVSGVLVRLQRERVTPEQPHAMGVIFTLLDGRALKAEGLAESVAAAVGAGVPTYVHIPGPPGHTSSQAQVNEALLHSVTMKDKAAILDILRMARAQGRAGKHVAVTMKRP